MRNNTMRLKKALVNEYSYSPFTAFSLLKGLRCMGEPVDIFATELRKLAKESGFTEGAALERVVRLVLVTGLSEKVSNELQQKKKRKKRRCQSY